MLDYRFFTLVGVGFGVRFSRSRSRVNIAFDERSFLSCIVSGSNLNRAQVGHVRGIRSVAFVPWGCFSEQMFAGLEAI